MIDKLMSGSSLENTIVPNSSSTKKVKSFVPKTSKQVLQLCYWDLQLNKKLRASITEASIPSSYADLERDIYYDILNWFILSGKFVNRCRKWEFNQRAQQHIFGFEVLHTGEISFGEEVCQKIKIKIWTAVPNSFSKF